MFHANQKCPFTRHEKKYRGPSDKGKTFKGSKKKLFLSQHGIVWKFNAPRAPWWSGFFERMMRSVKRCLKKTFGNARLTYEEFQRGS